MRSNRRVITSLLLALIAIVGFAVPAVAFSANPSQSVSTPGSATHGELTNQPSTQRNSSVNVTVGQQLATVIAVSSDDVQTEFENTAFEFRVERADDEARAEAIAARAEELRDRAEAIREDYEMATEAYEDGKISTSEYAQRLADLNARASNLQQSSAQLSASAETVSSFELRAADANLTGLDVAIEDLSSVTGPGTSALLAQFLGDATGEIKLETANGIEIEIEREDGEASREFERPRDANMNIAVPQADALQSARDAVSPPEEGRWVLVESKVKPLDGAFEFEFALVESADLHGEAKVRVDGSTGEVYRLEQEVEPRDDDAKQRDELTILVAEGSPAPGAMVTLQVLTAGKPVVGATVFRDDEPVGTTNANGTVEITLPEAGEIEYSVEHGDADGELEFDFGHEHETNDVLRKLDADASFHDDTVTVEVRFDGEPVKNATVYADDERVGTTGPDGTIAFGFDVASVEELELEVIKGAFEAELTFALHDGSLTLVEAEHESDDNGEREDDDPGDRGDDAATDDDEDPEPVLEMTVVDGTPEPGATVTVEVTADGDPVEGATVTLDGDVVGATNADGRIDVSFPLEDSVDLRAEYGDADTRLKFEFEYEEPERETETED